MLVIYIKLQEEYYFHKVCKIKMRDRSQCLYIQEKIMVVFSSSSRFPRCKTTSGEKKIEIKPIWITSHQQNFTCNRMKSPTSFSNALASDGQVSPTACICFSKRQYSLPITEKQCQPSSLFLSSLDSTENIPVAFPPQKIRESASQTSNQGSIQEHNRSKIPLFHTALYRGCQSQNCLS